MKHIELPLILIMREEQLSRYKERELSDYIKSLKKGLDYKLKKDLLFITLLNIKCGIFN